MDWLQVVDTNDNPLGIVEDTDETGNLLIIRGRIDSKEYSVPKNTVIMSIKVLTR